MQSNKYLKTDVVRVDNVNAKINMIILCSSCVVRMAFVVHARMYIFIVCVVLLGNSISNLTFSSSGNRSGQYILMCTRYIDFTRSRIFKHRSNHRSGVYANIGGLPSKKSGSHVEQTRTKTGIGDCQKWWIVSDSRAHEDLYIVSFKQTIVLGAVRFVQSCSYGGYR